MSELIILSQYACIDIDKLKEMPLISRYLSEKILDIEKYNASIGGEKERRRLTNLGTLRAYLLNYLKNHDGLNTETMTLLVRQLAPTAVGVPLELYTFTNTQQTGCAERRDRVSVNNRTSLARRR